MIKLPPKFQKYFPIILVVVALGLLTGVVLFIRSRNTSKTVQTETGGVIEVALKDRPVASLTPSQDSQGCIELALKIDKIKIKAETMDYELLYQLPDGRTQGVPGTIDISKVESVEKEGLLLGSESSGRKRCDEGVREGTLTLRFRDGKGKLLTKFTTKFSLQSGDKELKTVENDFTYTLTKASKDFFVTMQTFGIPGDIPGEIVAGPFGIFSSSTSALPGTVKIEGVAYMAEGSKWQKLEGGTSSNIGIFIGASE